MTQNNSKELIKLSILSAINDLKSTNLMGIDNQDKVDDLKIFEDSLSVVIFFTSLEASLNSNFKSKVEIDIEVLITEDLEKIETIYDLMNVLSKSIEL